MIRVSRRRQDRDGKSIQPDAEWFSESKDLTKELILNGKPSEYNEKFYQDDRVRAALEELFNGKCSYCETKIESFDVDHFRPKGRVDGTTHGGYYWLAYSWENLYPSCIHCNRKRRDKPLWDDQTILPAGGKADKFPIGGDGIRAAGPHDDLSAEVRLLLDPCEDDPSDHLGYDPIGGIYAIGGSLIGLTSIEVYHLSRRRLRRRRGAALRDFLNVLRSNPGHVAEYIADEREYAGLCRFVLSDPGVFGISTP